jgi:tetratricopeptide (TPR) repeat protein
MAIHMVVVALLLGSAVAALPAQDLEADFRAGRLAAVQARARELVHSQPNNFNAWMYLGLANARLGNQDAAAQAFERAIAINPADARPYLNVALVYAQRNDIDGAIAAYQKGLALDDHNFSAFYNYGRLLLARGRPRDAVVAFERAAKLNDLDAGAQVELSKLYLSLNDSAAAERAGRRAIELAHEDLDGNLALAEVLIASRRHDDAAALLARIERSQANSSAFQYTFGVAQMGLRRYGAAVESFQKAIQLQPKFELAHFLLGTAHYARSEMDAAETCFRTAIWFNAKNPIYYSYLARVYEAKGPTYRQASLETTTKLLALNPGDVEGRLRLAKWAKEEGDLPRARALLEQVVADDPRSAAAHVMLATIYYRLNLRKQAEEQQNIARSLEREAQNASPAARDSALPDPR